MKGMRYMLIDKLTTSYYRVLALLYERRLAVGDKFMVPITQAEVVEMTGINKTTVNKIFKELDNDKLISYDTEKLGRYYITDKGIDVVRKIKAIKD